MKCNTLRLKQLDPELVESVFTSSIGEVIDEAPLLRREMLHDLPFRVPAPFVLFIKIFLVFIVCITTSSSITSILLSASQAIAVQARVAVIAVLVVAFFVVGGSAVVRTTVYTWPVFAADVAEIVTAFASGTC